MNDREIAVLQSIDKTIDLCTRKGDDFKNLPGFNAGILQLDGLVKNMRKQSQVLDINTRGFTNAKNTAKDKLIDVTLPIVARIQAFAIIAHDQVLQNAVKINSTSLIKLHESMLGNSCRAVWEICTAKASELAPYDLTSEMTNELNAAIIDFEAKLIGSPQYRGEQKAAKQSFDSDYADATSILKNTLDVLASIIKSTNPALYAEYKNSRQLELAGSRSIALKCKVVDATSSQPIAGVMVRLVKIEAGSATNTVGNPDATTLIKRTTPKGGFQLKTLPGGTYTLTATKPGYTADPMTIFVNDGEMSDVEVRMGRG